MKTLLTLACASLMFASIASYGKEKLTFYTEQFPPYNMTMDGKAFAHKAEDISGLCTDMVKQMITQLPYDTQIKLRNWNYGMSTVKRKLNHGLFCTARTPEREDSFKWVGPLTEIRWTLFAKPDSSITLESLDDARQYRIGGYKGDVMTAYLEDKGFEVSALVNDSVNPKRLLLGQIDLWVADELSGPYVASDSADINGLKPVLTFNVSPLYLAINADTDQRIIDELNKAFESVRRSGQLEVIERTYGR